MSAWIEQIPRFFFASRCF